MWTYNQTQSSDELMHYGIPGMKWGHRKNPQVASARTAYKSAKKDFRRSAKNYRRSAGLGIGIKSIARARKAESSMRDAEMRMIDKKAKYNASKAKKAEFNTYRKEMQKSGIVGSAADERSRGRSESMYNHMKRQKGKEYADAVQKKVQNTSIRRFVTSSAIAVGGAAVTAYLNAKNM